MTLLEYKTSNESFPHNLDLYLFRTLTTTTKCHVVRNICKIVKMNAILLLSISAHLFSCILFHRQHDLRGRFQFESYIKKNSMQIKYTLKIEQAEMGMRPTESEW